IPLSHAQQRLWFLHQLEGPTPTYNIPTALRLTGKLDHHALRQALNDLVARHETLRTVIGTDDQGPRQTILPATEAVPEVSVTRLDREELPERLVQAAHHCFDLASEIPVRAWLFQLADDEHVLFLLLHHIASDAWSRAPMSRDFVTAYAARARDCAPQWDPLRTQYADYALWQHELLGAEADAESLVARQLAYWKQQLAGLPDELPLPLNRPRPAVASPAGARAEFTVPAELHRQLTGVARQNGASLFMVLQAALATLLTRLGAGTDIPIGAPIAGRTDEATDDLVGFFVNTLVLRTDTSGNPTFRQLLNRVRDTDLDAYAHQDLPFERLVEHLNPTRTLAHHPLFQIMLILNNTRHDSLRSLRGLDGLQVTAEGTSTEVARTDLAFELSERTGADGLPAGLTGSVRYRTDLFDAAPMQALTDRLLRLLKSVAEDPDRSLPELEVLSAEERHTVVTAWNDTAQPLPGDSLSELFEAQAARTPDAEALVSEDATLTYAELNDRANRLARLLREYGAGPERFVALALPRSPLLVTVLLAIAKSGAAYLPVDPEYPHERVNHMLRETSPVLMVTTEELAAGLPAMPSGTPLLSVDGPAARERTARAEGGNLAVEQSGDQVAYAMYTSGSTGRPKGVATTRRGVVALVRDRCWRAEAQRRVLFHAPHTFDASTYELWVPLVVGGTVVVAPPGPLDVAGLTALVTEHAVTALHLTAGLFRVVADEAPHCFSPLREVLTGGDVVSPAATATVLRHAPHVTFRHLYGPTESTLCATQHELRAPYVPEPSLPIGRPLDNTQTYVLDTALRPVPPGVVGELHIAGQQLARGYHRRPGLTAERFLANPYGPPGSRMYRTGDLARWRDDGRLEFLGRADDQIKVRGHRVEPGEIEAVLATHPAVTQATVLLREDAPGDRRLVAYLVTERDGLDAAELRTHLRTALPDYMIPAGFVPLRSLPLTPNGKLDQRALPAPDFGSPSTGREPRGEREELLAGLFAETLRLDAVGVDDGFFDLGGDSIMSIQLVARARTRGLALTVRDVFEHQTVAALAEIAADAGTTAPTLPAIDRAGPVPVTPVMHEFLARGGPVNEFNQSVLVATPPQATTETLTRALQSLLDRHDSLRLRLGRSSDGWEMSVLPPGTPRASDCLTRVDATAHTDPAALHDLAAEARALLDPQRGHNLRALHLDRGPDRPGHLALVVHHLSVDSVSWRILLDDLAALHTAATGAEDSPEPPAPATHWRQWATGLQRRAEEAGRADAAYWAQLPTEASPLALVPERDTYATVHRTRVRLGPDVTETLLTRAPALYRTTITEVLLSAFSVAVTDWRRSHPHLDRPGRPIVLDLETHGRHEEALPGADLTRTTGWFTNVHPVWFQPRVTDWTEIWDGGPALGRVVKEVKEQRGAIPDQGLTYGLLRYLSPRTEPRLARQAAPPYAFNYFGRATSGADDTPWSITANGIAGTHPDTPLSHPVTLSALTLDTEHGPELHSTWSYASELISKEEIEQLAHSWTRALEALAAHTRGEGAGGLTPSDITHSSLGQAEIEEFEAEFALEEDF
ncbi:non-ribosomal peptide synthase domain TIGR01720/amino acid adenylation domain-containing protein, partial [Streptomyces zhaozhouensis]